MEGVWYETLPRTNKDFDVIELLKSNPYKDFGRGFYLTDIKEQAEAMAEKKSRLFGGKAIVQEYEFGDSILEGSELKILKFESPSEDWATFIYKNRNRDFFKARLRYCHRTYSK